MGGTTTQGLRYPYLDEVITSVSQKNLADDIDGALDTDDTALQLGLHRPSARLTRSASQTSTGNAAVNPTWAVEVYDTDTMGNIGTNNERMTIKTAGLWMFGATLLPTGYGASHVAWHLGITKNGTVVGRKLWYGVLATAEPFSLTVSATFVGAVNDIIRVESFKYGASGTFTIGTFWGALQTI